MRGGVPKRPAGVNGEAKSSPRVRGCSACPTNPAETGPVFPACAGVFRDTRCAAVPGNGLPRVRGSVPGSLILSTDQWMSSPRVRGCSRDHVGQSIRCRVFPACAGVFPQLSQIFSGQGGLPRVCGGVPATVSGVHGSSLVFPACAGVFPAKTRPPWPALGSSPRARGSSLCLRRGSTPCTVFPAYAGVVKERRRRRRLPFAARPSATSPRAACRRAPRATVRPECRRR